MNFVELVLTVCMISNPQSCDERRLMVEMGSLRGCMMQAQPYIAQWAGDHPGLSIQRWRCVAPGSEGSKI